MSVIKKPMGEGCYGMFVLILLITGGPVAVGATPHFVYTRCFEAAGNYTPQSLFQSNLNSLLSDLVVALNSSSSYSNSIGESPDDVVHGLFYCRGDVGQAECCGCAQAAAARVVLDCPSEKEAVIWHEECTFRYSAGQADDVEDVWASQQATATTTVSVTADVSGRLFDGLVREAAYSNINLDNGSSSSSSSSMVRYFQKGKTTVTSTVSLEGMVQCAPQMSESQCEGCLRNCVGVIPSCCGWQREWVTVVRPSCLVEYRYFAADAADPVAGQYSSSSSSSSSTLLPDAHSTWGNIKFYLTLTLGITITVTVSITASYTCVAKCKHEFDLTPKQPHKCSKDQEKQKEEKKEEEKKEEEKETTMSDCNCGCGSGSNTDDGCVVLVPIQTHCGGYPSTNYQGYPSYSGFPPSHCRGSSFSRCEY